MSFEEFDLDNLKIEIRRATPVRYRRAKIWVKRPNAKITITKREAFSAMRHCPSFMVEVFNHEFLHWIICLLTKTKPQQYDRYLEAVGLYRHEYLAEEML